LLPVPMVDQEGSAHAVSAGSAAKVPGRDRVRLGYAL